MTAVEISRNGAGTKSEVVLDGFDVARSVSAFAVKARYDTVTEVTLTLAVTHNFHFTGEARVDLDPVTAELLQRLGWTPPNPAVVLPPASPPSVEHDPVGEPPSS